MKHFHKHTLISFPLFQLFCVSVVWNCLVLVYFPHWDQIKCCTIGGPLHIFVVHREGLSKRKFMSQCVGIICLSRQPQKYKYQHQPTQWEKREDGCHKLSSLSLCVCETDRQTDKDLSERRLSWNYCCAMKVTILAFLIVLCETTKEYRCMNNAWHTRR